jgi:hypothetical protein
MSRRGVPIRDYFEAILREKDRALDAALVALNEATRLLAETIKENREQQNEWRQAMNDRERQFLTRRELYQIVATIATVVVVAVAIINGGNS